MSLPLRKQGNAACAIVVLLKKKKGLIRYFSKIREQNNSFFHFSDGKTKKAPVTIRDKLA